MGEPLLVVTHTAYRDYRMWLADMQEPLSLAVK